MLSAWMSVGMPFFILYMCRYGTAPLREWMGLVVAGNADISVTADVLSGISVCLLRATLFSLCIGAVNKRWFKVTVYVLFFAGVGLGLFLQHVCHLSISPRALTLLLETSSSEAADFIRAYVCSSATLGVLLRLSFWVFFALLSEWFWHRCRRRITLPRGVCRVVMALWPAVCAAGLYEARMYVELFSIRSSDYLRQWEARHEYGVTDALSKTLASVQGMRVARAEMRGAVEVNKAMSDRPRIELADSCLDVVFVIGESYNKWHSSLYGYPLHTTPCLDRERDAGRLYAFTDVITPYNYTSRTLRQMLSCNHLSAGEAWNSKPLFPAVMKRAGYEVLWWDNQRDMDRGSSSEYALNSFLYHPDIVRACYSQCNRNTYEYDGQLVDDLLSNGRMNRPYNLVVLHLLGQHVMADSRFPHTVDNLRFRADEVPVNVDGLGMKERGHIADYDNATYYNDRVMDRLFRHFGQRNAVLVYLSDHGEEMYDYRPLMGRVSTPLTPDMLKYQYEVPFMVWMSDSYMKRHPQVVREVRHAVSRPYSVDEVSMLLFYLSGVRTVYYEERRNVVSPRFRPYRRLVNDGEDYDAIRLDRPVPTGISEQEQSVIG